MKIRAKLFFGIGIICLLILHWFIFSSKEGFFDDSSDYENLRKRLQADLADYCKVSIFVSTQVSEAQQQMSKMQQVSQVPPPVPYAEQKDWNRMVQDSDTQKPVSQVSPALGEPVKDIGQIYKGVYECSDALASSRPSCKLFVEMKKMEKVGLIRGLSANPSGIQYTPCSTFTNLPEWSTTSAPVIALMKIKNDLVERITRETEWFAAVIAELQHGLSVGDNPPMVQEICYPPGKDPPRTKFGEKSDSKPTSPSTSEMNHYAKIAEDHEKNGEGFQTMCSADAALLKEAASCSLPSISDEISRINTLLDNPTLKQYLSKCKELMVAMLKLQSDLEKAKNGTLYEWQKNGPKKSLPAFKGGDRTQSFLFSVEQNR